MESNVPFSADILKIFIDRSPPFRISDYHLRQLNRRSPQIGSVLLAF
ncbi:MULTISPECIES: hypothetical protein [Arthrospira]|nr:MULTISPECIES: hypothetical protein [Arthrospira]MBD2668142.1 hypothetical protein [Arthrospira platensis FACHB-439]MBD2708701.1 hypothetical protein [Arthrospira platensis FACHB-835]MDF2212355.1 hypothetical protein [Arthrospira platensis NCB002]MDT9181558.1 hypothetical protein [Limnospira sp. PMC 289.06]MDT9293818.1 hypothetical protein [Arthrospira platensis PCC 7345]MDT9309279.1 hypothetical protein [Limnospira sp. Paracas R14]QQW27599.1 hypothetical protein AP9108_20615 [Arthrospira 